jgi:hypothetical protein
MQGFKCGTPSLLVASAFPALERLAVVNMPLTYMDLEQLSVCTHLTALELDSCQLTNETGSSQATITSPLAAVSSIRQLKLSGVSSTLARGLTQLTSLHLGSRQETMEDFKRSISGMCSLQELRVGVAKNWTSGLSMPMLKQLVTTAAQLKVLELHGEVEQKGIDLLLTHAKQLTHLTCDSLEVTEDRSQSACSWVELDSCLGSFSELAYLPLHNIQRLRWGELEVPSPCPCAEITLYEDQQEAREWPRRIRDAIANLGRCPAWQLSGSAVKCNLAADEEQLNDPLLLAETVAALSGFANRELQLSISSSDRVVYDAPLLQQLGRIVGSGLTQLEIGNGHICRDFWPAVWAHLPRLTQLSLGCYLHMDNIYSQDIVAFCIRAARPLQLCLDEGLEGHVGPADRLQELCTFWGGPQVTIKFYAGLLS